MKISAKSRYALAALIQMGQLGAGERPITIQQLSDKLNISKIYLEQVFSLLKRAGIVSSSRGAQGGYRFTRPLREITAYDILLATENTLFQKTEQSLAGDALGIETVLQKEVFTELDSAVRKALTGVKLDFLVEQSLQQTEDAYMFYL